MTVPASQTSRRLAENWREVAIYKHFCENADGFVETSSHVFAAVHLCFKFFVVVFKHLLSVLTKDVCFCVRRHVYNAQVQPFSFHI